MATLTLDAVDKIYRPRGKRRPRGDARVARRSSDGEIVGAARLVGLRQDLDAAHDRRLRGACREGTITLAGRRDQRPAARRERNVAMAFEGYSLYPPLTVRDNIGFACCATGIPTRRGRAARVAEIAKLLEIEDILDRYPPSISGGQQQRASLARALVRAADLYLLDEPMGQLEPQLRAVLRARIKHYLHRAQDDDGARHPRPDRGESRWPTASPSWRTACCSSSPRPRELKERPANLFVATLHRRAADERLRRPGRAREWRPGGRGAARGGDGRLRLSACRAWPAERWPRPSRHPRRIAIGVSAARARRDGAAGTVSPTSGSATRPISPLDVGGVTVVAVAHQRVAGQARRARSAFTVACRSDLHLFDAARRRRPGARPAMAAAA